MFPKGCMWVFSMVYSLEDAIVVCGGFPATTRRIVCIARGIEGHAWQGPPLRSDKKNGQDNVHWMVFVMHRACTTANYDNGLNQTVMMMSCNHIILLCTTDVFNLMRCVLFLDNLESSILLVLGICMGLTLDSHNCMLLA